MRDLLYAHRRRGQLQGSALGGLSKEVLDSFLDSEFYCSCPDHPAPHRLDDHLLMVLSPQERLLGGGEFSNKLHVSANHADTLGVLCCCTILTRILTPAAFIFKNSLFPQHCTSRGLSLQHFSSHAFLVNILWQILFLNLLSSLICTCFQVSSEVQLQIIIVSSQLCVCFWVQVWYVNSCTSVQVLSHCNHFRTPLELISMSFLIETKTLHFPPCNTCMSYSQLWSDC